MDLKGVDEKMEKALTALKDDLATVKTGRATPALVEKIMVEAYDTKMPLVELATITAPEPNQLVVAPFDRTILKEIELAITRHRELKLSPVIDDSGVIRIQIPPLTAERREQFVKILRQKLETGRIMVRQVRGEKRQEIKRAFEAKELSEDEKFQLEEELQKITDEFMEKIESMGEAKEKELRTV